MTLIKKRNGFSTFDILMYLAFLAMMVHYTKPNYDQIALQIRSLQYLQPLNQSQLKVKEYLFFHQALPETLVSKKSQEYAIDWDGEGFSFSTPDSSLELYLKAHYEDRVLSWSCDYDSENEICEYLCHALT